MKMVDRWRTGRVLQAEPGQVAIRLPAWNGHTSDAMLTPINILLAKNHRPELLVGDGRQTSKNTDLNLSTQCSEEHFRGREQAAVAP
jgi:hypothetical protein